MRINLSHALGGYAAVMTLAVVWLATSAMASPPSAAKFTTLDVQRINVREPDGTLRLAISNHALIPGIAIGKKEYPHPDRPEAGMIFYNREGTENGGLVFDGEMKDGKPTNGGSLTFDRYRQDQTLQLVSEEDGANRKAGLAVIDRPDMPMDIEALLKLRNQPPSAGTKDALKKAGYEPIQRAWLGRVYDGKVALVLSDTEGHPRLMLGVGKDGTPSVDLLDANGKVTRSIR